MWGTIILVAAYLTTTVTISVLCRENKDTLNKAMKKDEKAIRLVRCSLCGIELKDDNDNYVGELKNCWQRLEMDRKFLFLYTKHGVLNESFMHCCGDICKDCYNKVSKEIEKANELERIFQGKKDTIEVYPRSYKGEIPISSGSEFYQTKYYVDKEDPEQELKRYAVITHRNAIVDCKEVYEKDMDGNYIYKKWGATGRIT